MELHEGLKSLGDRAFYGCKLSSKDITLPKSLKNKGKCIFGEDENDALKSNVKAKLLSYRVGAKTKNISQNKDSGKTSPSVEIKTKSISKATFTSFEEAAEFLK